VRLELQAINKVTCILRPAVLAALMGVAATCQLYAQKPKPNLPDPIKFTKKNTLVGNVVYSVLDEMGFRIELDDRQNGKIVTRPYEFITGSLTSSEVDKVAIKKDTITSTWLKARYSVEALIEIVSPSETMVTIRTKMEGLNQDIDGTEKWLPLESLGTYERRILGRISTKLMGTDEPANEKKGFWGKSPQPVDSRQPRLPTAPPR
jgi:hypothetical protein